MFFDEDSIECSVCHEMNDSSCTRCQNCRSRLIHDSLYYNNNFNVFNDFNDELDLDYDYNNNENFILPCNEILEVKKMSYSLYNKGKNGVLEPPICSICRENIELEQNIYLLSCNHFYHQFCITEWFKEKSECPYCRKKFIIHFK